MDTNPTPQWFNTFDDDDEPGPLSPSAASNTPPAPTLPVPSAPPQQPHADPTLNRELTERLADSTALISRLRQRWQLAEANTQIQADRTQQAQLDAKIAHAEIDIVRATRRKGWSLVALLLVVFVACVLWSWYNRVEWEYIRKRQYEKFGM